MREKGEGKRCNCHCNGQLSYGMDCFKLHRKVYITSPPFMPLYTPSDVDSLSLTHTHHLGGTSLSVISIQYSAEFWVLASLSVQRKEEEEDEIIKLQTSF